MERKCVFVEVFVMQSVLNNNQNFEKEKLLEPLSHVERQKANIIAAKINSILQNSHIYDTMKKIEITTNDNNATTTSQVSQVSRSNDDFVTGTIVEKEKITKQPDKVQHKRNEILLPKHCRQEQEQEQEQRQKQKQKQEQYNPNKNIQEVHYKHGNSQDFSLDCSKNNYSWDLWKHLKWQAWLLITVSIVFVIVVISLSLYTKTK